MRAFQTIIGSCLAYPPPRATKSKWLPQQCSRHIGDLFATTQSRQATALTRYSWSSVARNMFRCPAAM